MSAQLAMIWPRVPVPAGGSPDAGARHLLVPGALPQWRALLEFHWQERLERVTELSLAYHEARDLAGDGGGQHAESAVAARCARLILRRTVAERRALAEIEAALARLAGGRYGRCEQCGAAIAVSRLAEAPQARYCPACDR
jgi:RNA polymerase-binding transcription factor DksA